MRVEEELSPLIQPDPEDPKALRFDALLYGLELALLAKTSCGRARRDLLGKVQAVSKLSNIPEVAALERILWSEVGTKQEYEAELGAKPLGEFVREIVGLDMGPANAVFAEYLDGAGLGSRQIYFVNQIVEYIVRNGLMKDLSLLQGPPFTDHGSVVEVFTDLPV